MNMHLIAVAYTDKTMKDILGFRILDSDAPEGINNTMDVPYANMVNTLKSNKNIRIHGLSYDSRKQKVVATNGSFDRYTALAGGLKKGNKIVILGAIDDIGYKVCNYMGQVSCATVAALLKVADKVGIANGKVVTKNSTRYISAISGKYDLIPFDSLDEVSKNKIKNIHEDIKMNEEAKAEISKVQAKGIYDTAKIMSKGNENGINELLKELDPDTGMTVEQKMVYGMFALKKIRPFYYSLYCCLNKVATTSSRTFAVDLTTFYFNPNFALECSLGKLLFIMIHEVCHVAMKHNIRRRGRKPKVWNYACDYYINRLIAVEFGLTVKEKLVPISVNGNSTKYKILLPDDALYNPNIDVDTDTPEKIYDELMAAAKNKSQENNNSGNSDSSDGGNNCESKNNQDNKDENNDDDWSPEESLLDGLDMDDDNGGSGDGDDDGDDSGDGDENGNGSSNGKGSKNSKGSQNKQGGSAVDSSNGGDDIKGATFRGETIENDVDEDLVMGEDETSQSSDKAEQVADSMLRRAITVTKQTFGTFGGPSASFIERYVERVVAPKVNWKSLLKNKLTLASQKINTFAAPDKRFRSRGMIMPGPKKLENDTLDNVKICIDTSGSIGTQELCIALNQIEQLFKQYKVKAELLYWDTEIRARYNFTKVDELLTLKPMGGGGTDVNCVFREFEEGKDYRIGKKPRPTIIIIFTDGYFGTVDKKYKKYKDTIWILQSASYHDFKEPFGVKAPINMKNVD